MAEMKSTSVVDNHARSMSLQDEKLPALNSTGESQRSDDVESTGGVIAAHGGVTRVEAFNKVLRQDKSGKVLLWILGISIGLTMFVYSIDQGTTYFYNQYATAAFQQHSQLTTVATAAQIMRAIAVPFLGKLADITSRPTTYVVVLIFYVVGFAASAGSNGIASYTVGQCFTAIGKSGLDFLGTLIVADLTNLQWRGFYGSLLALPFIVTSFIDGFITDYFTPDLWRWGNGMFAIMIPVLLLPAIVTLYVMESKAKKHGMVSIGASKLARTGELEKVNSTSWLKLFWQGIIDIDLVGLILLALGFALILLSLTLYPTAKGGFSNSSMIAMIVVGFVFLIVFTAYEYFLAPKPVCSRHIWKNKAFISAIGIDVSTQLASGVHSLYYSSYITGVKRWTQYEINTFTNMVTVLLCIFGPIVGLYMAKTHRFKAIMTWGVLFKIIGYSAQMDGIRSTKSTGVLIVSQIFLGLGAFSVVGARVGSQASVPHSDLASIIAQLSLWSTLAASVGYAIAGAIWQNDMPGFMREECPASVTDAQIRGIYASIATLARQPWDSALRQCGIVAYTRVNGYLFIASIAIGVVGFFFCFLMPNYYLGEEHNVVTKTKVDGEHVSEGEAAQHHNQRPVNEVVPSGVFGKLKHFWLKEY